MEKISTKGMVIREVPFRERDRILHILTESNGVVSAVAKGAQGLKSRLVSSTSLMSYSQFELYPSKGGMYTVDDARLIDNFPGLRKDVEKLSLAVYFMELIYKLAPDELNLSLHLRLALNSIAFLQQDKLPANQIKPIFELRLLAMSGYMPDLIGCSRCGNFVDRGMYFSPQNSDLLCQNCIVAEDKNQYVKLSASLLAALRHIFYSEFNKLFSFRVDQNTLKALSDISEHYLLAQTDGYFKTLQFYKSLLSGEQTF